MDEKGMSVTQEEIANRREQLEERLAAIQYQEKDVQRDLETLRRQCYHPGVTPSVRTGGGSCPACGLKT
jgi:hypothetical protein